MGAGAGFFFGAIGTGGVLVVLATGPDFAPRGFCIPLAAGTLLVLEFPAIGTVKATIGN